MANIKWLKVAAALAKEPPETEVHVPKLNAQHPLDAGLRPSLGLPVGQQADFRLRMDDCRGLHVRDFGNHYEAHLDRVDPDCSLPEHLRLDAPGAYVAGAGALGALVGLCLGRTRESVLVGSIVGAVLGGLAAAEEARSPGGGTRCIHPRPLPESSRSSNAHAMRRGKAVTTKQVKRRWS
jgi:hypothetical protein